MPPNSKHETEVNNHGPVSTSTLSKNSEEFYNRLINEGPHVPGDSMELTPVSEIPWANTSRLKAGTLFAARNLFSIIISGGTTLFLGFAARSQSSVILRAGKSHSPEESFPRMMSMTSRLRSWWEGDITDITSDSYKNIQVVRKLHHYYGKKSHGAKPFPSLDEMGYTEDAKELMDAIRKDLEHLDVPADAPIHLNTWDPILPFSQFDMAIAQFANFAFLYLFPEVFGISGGQGMDDFIHYWAIVGRLLGLEDRFNIALLPPDVELYKKLSQGILVHALKSSDERVICLQNALTNGLKGKFPLPASTKGWLYWTLTETGLSDMKEVWKIMNKMDKFGYYFFKWSWAAIRCNSGIRMAFNFLMKHGLNTALRSSRRKGCPVM